MIRFILSRLIALGAAVFMAPALAAAESASAGLIPAQMTLPAPWGLLELLLILTFFIHIVLVNIVLGSCMLAAVNFWKSTPAPGGPGGDTSFATGTLALAVNFGVAPFLFLQVAYGSFVYTSSVLMAVWWMSMPFMVMLAYYGLYVAKSAGAGGQARRLAVSLAALLLMATAFLLVNNISLSTRPAGWAAWLERPGGTLLNLGDPSLWPRYLHILAASLAVGGLFMAGRVRWLQRKAGASTPAEAEACVRRGLELFVYASLAQALIGIWYLFTLPAPVRALFLGQSVFSTAALLLALLGLAGAIMAARAGRVRLTAAFTLGVILIMACIRAMVRAAKLTPYNQDLSLRAARELLEEASASEVSYLPQLVHQAVEIPLPAHTGQGAAFAFFLLCAFVGAALIVWMLRVAIKTFNGAPGAAKGE